MVLLINKIISQNNVFARLQLEVSDDVSKKKEARKKQLERGKQNEIALIKSNLALLL